MTSTKTGGLGQHFAFGGYLIGGDIQSATMHGGAGVLDVTDITQSAHSRLLGLRDGEISVVAYMNPSAGAEHAAFSPLSRSDILAMYLAGQSVGSPALCQNSKQLNYDPTRAADGGLTEKVDCQSDQYGQEWGVLLTPGPRTDTAAANGTSYDHAASTSFGAQAYLQAVSFAGTDVTVTIQDSADNSSFANVTGLSFSQITGSTPLAQRIAVSNTSTIRRYVRAITTTSGGFTSFKFIVAININPVAGVVF